MSVFDAALFKLLFDFVKSEGGPTLPYSPLQSAVINNKQLIAVITYFKNLKDIIDRPIDISNRN
jgi:hypothetical protein